MTGYSLTIWWQVVSMLVVFGSLAGIAYCVLDALKEAHKLEEQTATNKSKREYPYTG